MRNMQTYPNITTTTSGHLQCKNILTRVIVRVGGNSHPNPLELLRISYAMQGATQLQIASIHQLRGNSHLAILSRAYGM